MATSNAALETPVRRSLRFGSIVPYLCVALAVGLYLFPFVRVLTWCPDEGAYEYGAQMTLHGALPARDFMDQYAPGSFYWLALFFKVFGISLVTTRGLLLFEGIATALLILHLSRLIGASGFFATVFIPVFYIPLTVMNSQHFDGNLFALSSLAVFLAAQRELGSEASKFAKGRLLLFLAGVLAGITSCFIQHKGFWILIALILSILVLHSRNRFRLAAIVFAGYCCALSVELLPFVFTRAIPDLIYSDFLLPLRTYNNLNAVSYGFPIFKGWFPWWFRVTHASFPLPVAVLLTAAIGVPFLVILFVPLLALTAPLWRAPIFRRDLIPYWFAGYALWISESHRLDIGHLRNGCLILIVLFFALCETAKAKFPKQLATIVAGCVVLPAVIYIMGALSARTVVQTRRGSLLAQKPDTALQFLLTHTHPGEEVLVYPYHPLYYFLADLRNPTRFCVMIYDPHTRFLFEEAVRDVERKKVRYVVWDKMFSGQNLTSLFPAYRLPSPDQLIMEPYLETHYHQIAYENGFRILERNQ